VSARGHSWPGWVVLAADESLLADTHQPFNSLALAKPDLAALAARGLAHARSGEVVLVAEEGAWFAYPWWSGRAEAPDYAAHVDIHNKPGYDPCELFFGWPPMSVSQNTRRIKGSHGRVGPGRETVWASTIEFPRPPENLLELAAAVRDWLDAG
jgi:hypothetical protein